MEFTWIDGVVLVVYFLAMASMGPLFASKNRTTEGYFLGDRSFSGWLVGFSMFATSISSITFMAYPADAYKTCWLRMIPNFMLPLAVLAASRVFLPFFRRSHLTSAYEYLEERFGPNVRLYASSAFVLGQVIRVSLILYLVSELVQSITGFPSIYCVFIGGIITSFYTITGGIRAVLWTDFTQAVVLWVGGILCLLMIAIKLGGPIDGLVEIVRVGVQDGKFQFADYIASTQTLKPVDWGFSLANKTVLMLLLVGLGDWMKEYSSDQNVVQRYCASRSPKQARIAMWVCCWFSLPTWALFMFLGTGLYVFYKYHPTPEAVAMIDGTAKAEGILPYFVIQQLPPGISGLVIAAVLAAAMSSISSSMSSVSVVSVVDIYKRHFAKDRDDKHYLMIARLSGVAMAVIMIIGALVLVTVKGSTLQDTARILGALTSGGLLGLFLFGFLTKRGDGRAIGVGIICTLIFTAYMTLSIMKKIPEALRPPIDSYYPGLLGHIMMFAIGYFCARLIFRERKRDLTNLTVWTQDGSPME